MSHSTHFNYSCDKCGKQFYGKKNLALHMKTHYTDEEKKHVCTVCGYRFAKIKFLKNHMTTHSDIRQYACEVRYWPICIQSISTYLEIFSHIIYL